MRIVAAPCGSWCILTARCSAASRRWTLPSSARKSVSPRRKKWYSWPRPVSAITRKRTFLKNVIVIGGGLAGLAAGVRSEERRVGKEGRGGGGGCHERETV